MHKIVIKLLLVLGVVFLMTGCGEDKKEITEKANEAAINYLKEEKDIAFEPESIEFTSAIGGGTVSVNGYDKTTLEKYNVYVNYGDEKGYWISGYGTGEEVETEEVN
ncbi:hypothetical protein [Peribacillus sp. NPDC097295]|uniref:hypothetical protein n=1 Tax=Peribacillus sp. NPDC097295 TaxID=3364402 RepID=UPI00380F1ABD